MGTVARSAHGDCLAGGGEMGAVIRAFDWSTTRLGPVVRWPQSLRTAVSIMLDSAFAMVVAWGPEFVFLYNDRYRPVLGATKHPGALGKPAKDIFPEVWGFIGPLFEKTRNGEAVALDDVLIPLDRNGYLEDCYFMLSYSVIRDESGGVGGMLAVVAETTERVQAERRLVTLRDLAALGDARNADDACQRAELVLAQNPVDLPFSLLYLLRPDGHRARLAAATGVTRGAAAAPGEVVLDDGARWPLGEAYRVRRTIVVDDLRARFGTMPGGPYPQPAHTALVLPMPRAGHDEPHGFFVVGVSPRCALDDRYRTFLGLARDHLVAALDKALAFEDERKRAEALAEIDRAKTALFSNISHEFRTPLTLMLGPLEAALARGSIMPDELDTAFRNALRLQKLVNALLEFSRIEAGRAQARFVPTNIGRSTVELAAMFESAMMRAGLRYVVRCDALEEPIYLDRDMYETILLNLLSNALKFTFHGEIEVALCNAGDRVELRVRDTGVGVAPDAVPRLFERFHRIEGTRARTHEGSGIGLALVSDLVKLHAGSVRADSTLGEGTTFTVSIPKGKAHLPADKIGAATGDRAVAATSAIVIHVTDTGIGIAPEMLPRVFEMFVQEHQALDRSRGGLGLGLTIVRSLVAMHGGTVEVHSEGHNRGSEFVVTLPAAAVRPPAGTGDAAAPSGARLGAGAGRRILVVDDNEDAAELLASALEVMGHTTRVAHDGPEALKLAAEFDPELALLDIGLPVMDGYELARRFHDHPDLRRVPLVAVTGYGQPSDRERSEAAGFDAHLVKPVDVDRVAALIRRLTERR
jgi:signal transduction histidine kinase/CheY-like chemotaxis protein